MATTPTRPETAEYITALRHITQVLAEVCSLIISGSANNSREMSRLDAELSEFQTRFQVALDIIVGEYLLSPGSLHMHLPCPTSQSRVSLEKFMQLPQVSVSSLLGDDNIMPKCSMCLKPFAEQMAQVPLTNENGENQPSSTELPAEIANSIGIPVRLPCGHVFDTDCIYSWISRGKSSPTCPLCRTTIHCVENPLTEHYVETFKLLCPEMLDSERVLSGLQELLMTFVATR